MILVKDTNTKIDELFLEAIGIVKNYDRASVSLLQRKLAIGYARASRLIGQLDTAGIISKSSDIEPRTILVQDNKKNDKSGKMTNTEFLKANTQLIKIFFKKNNINVKPVRVIIQKNKNILFLFDFEVTKKIDHILSFKKEIAAILASPTGEVVMGAPFKGTPFLFIYLPYKRKMKPNSYVVFDVDIKKININIAHKIKTIVRSILLDISEFISKLAYKI